MEPRRPFPPMGGWAASPDFLALLLRHAAAGARVIVKCGSGASTVVLARRFWYAVDGLAVSGWRARALPAAGR